MALSNLSHAYQKAFEPTAANTIEIKEIDEKYLLIAQQDENYFKSNNSLFRNLFRFISEYDIPMTTPVKAEINPGKMGFYISEKDYIKSSHDISLGGLSKMCIKGNKGIKIKRSKSLISEIEYLFSEDQGRYIIEIDPKNLKEVTKILDKNSVHHEELGIIIEKEMIINEKTKVTIDELKSYNTNWLTNFMSS